jgi:hypothetical protein
MKTNADQNADLAGLNEMKFQVVSGLFWLIYWSYVKWPHSKFPFCMETEHKKNGGVLIPELSPASRSAFSLHTVFLADNLVMKCIQEHSCSEMAFKFFIKLQEFCSLFKSG